MTVAFFDAIRADSSRQAAMLDVLQYSFLIPADVLARARSQGWNISELKVTSNEEFWTAYPVLVTQATKLTLLPTASLVKAAKLVAVSLRQSPNGQVTFIVAQLWKSIDRDPGFCKPF